MREIKFRGKDIKGNWHYGLLTHDRTPSFKSNYEWFISNKAGKPYAYGVIEETIGQCTGIKDKNGIEMCEGDIVKNGYKEGIISYDNGGCIGFETKTTFYHLRYFNVNDYEVMGNIHEN